MENLNNEDEDGKLRYVTQSDKLLSFSGSFCGYGIHDIIFEEDDKSNVTISKLPNCHLLNAMKNFQYIRVFSINDKMINYYGISKDYAGPIIDPDRTEE
ncbi:7540_t:CDS:2, partial [Entrophospora sp. SA101]